MAGRIKRLSWKHTDLSIWMATCLTQKLLQSQTYWCYHPDTPPLTWSYQTKQIQNTQRGTHGHHPPPHPKHPHNEPRSSSSHDRVSRSLCWSIRVRIIHDYGILSASPSFSTHSHTHLNIFPGVLRLFPYHCCAATLS